MSERLRALAKDGWSLVVDTANATIEDDINRIAAAMAYWLLVTMAPLVLVLSTVGAYLLAPGSKIADIVGHTVTEPTTSAVDVVGGALRFAGPYASLVAAVLVVVGAMSVFAQFVGAINVIWKSEPRRGAMYEIVRYNALAFLLLVVFGAGVFLALVIGTTAARAVAVISGFARAAGAPVPELTGGMIASPWIVGVLAALGMFAVAFWIVPQERPRLRDVLPGAVLTAIAYQIGATVLATSLPSSGRFAFFGVFGFFVIGIVFIYYVSLIALVGAEFTHQWVLRAERRRGLGPIPAEGQPSSSGEA